jgi:hypothetical protein
MNRLKTFFFYLGTILIANFLVTILVFISNNVFDSLPDVFFVPTKGAALGYIPFMIAAKVALETTNNYEGTRKILYIWKLFLASVFTFLGTGQLILGIYFGMPLFEFSEDITLFTLANHWLHYLPLGISGLIAGFQIKNNNLE